MTGGDALAWQLGAFVVAVALLVFVHEWGHFAVARRCGVKVLRFSIGFGRILASWRFRGGETQWSVSAIPLGGYVKMLDEREGPVAPEEAGRAFNNKPVVVRMLIVAAGPLANFLLAILLYWGVFLHGVEDIKPVLGPALVGSAAAEAGVMDKETVRALDGQPVGSWSEVRVGALEAMLQHRSFTLETIDTKGNIAFRRFDSAWFANKEPSTDPARDLGLQLHRPLTRPVVGTVVADSPAARAGIAVGQEIVAIDGRKVTSWEDVVQTVRTSPGQTLHLQVRHGNGQLVNVVAVPEDIVQDGVHVGRIGLGVALDPSARAAMMVTIRHGPVDALGKAFTQTADNCRLTLVMLGKMVTGKASLRNLSGPVAIADYAGQSARLGVVPYLGFLALISVSIGLLNLLPIPILDGGHLMYYLAEFIKGSPVSERLQQVGQYIGLGALGLLMTIAIVNDIHRLISG